jgi:hypothetical protein
MAMSPEATATKEKSGHPKLAAVLTGIATLIAIVAIFSIWANRQALNTDNWVNTSEKLLENPEVQARLSNYVAEELLANVDVKAELEQALPPPLKPLAGPAAGGIEQLAPQIAQRALESPRVQQLWSTANRAAHETLLKILDGGGDAVSTGEGEVTLDLGSVLKQVGERLGVGGAIAAKIPPDAGQLTILKSSELSTAQDVAKLIRRLPIVLTLLVVVLYGLAIYLAGPRRRRALRAVGLGFVFAGAVALIIRSLAGTAVVDALTANESAKPAAEAVWSIGTSLLVTVASSAIAFGILVFLGAWLAGPTRLATGIRREASPYVREQPGTALAVAGLIFIVLIAWAPIAAFRKPLGILLFAVLFAVGAELLRRQILREFPDSRPGEFWREMRERRQAKKSSSPEGATVDQLERLGALRDSGALSDAEFAAAKAEILGSPGPGDAPVGARP